ncbi:haloacid dehalogenase type II [Pararobbsia silviterrae]|uniref:(S)-2-haloacid dehalogenase n=1 Tax=Pararobbsia silviterrae TaxID=1792498 RepID=A0A494XD21_9BURK|nr:haloacid dehalogenase type II [Pararobbsia silviterrae]RKP47782.1 haloacid dehalogenase type II [Pararobbsia silviterrae]
MNRRHFIGALVASAAAGSVKAAPVSAATHGIKAVAFDGIALFDPRPIFALTEQMFPQRGAALVATWRARQFDYTWLRTMIGRYVDFMQVADDALTFAADAEKLAVTTQQRRQLLAGFMTMKAWPDVAPALRTLKQRGLGLAPLTDFSLPMLDAAISNSQLDGVFDHLLSTDLVKAYKPDPRSYQMGIDAFGLSREEIAFVAFGGWDAAGAKAFGYRTLWANRLNMPTERLGVVPDRIAPDFIGLPEFVQG